MSGIDASGMTAFAPLPVPVANIPTQKMPRQRLKRGAEPDVAAASVLIPLFYSALLFLSGIVLARFQYLRPDVLLASLLPLGVVSVVALFKAQRLRWLPMGLIWVVLGAWSAEMELQPAPNAAIIGLTDSLLRTVDGQVVDTGPLRRTDLDEEIEQDTKPWGSDEESGMPGASTKGAGRVLQRVDLEVTSAEMVTDFEDSMAPIKPVEKARIRLSVAWPDRVSGLSIACGAQIRVVVRVLSPDAYRDPGVWSRAAYLEGEEISALASVDAGKLDNGEPRLRLLKSSPSHSILAGRFPCWLNRWRNAASARLAMLPGITRASPAPFRASEDDAAMLAALLTGDRSWLTRRLRVGFERTGSFHLIVVSGLHLAILAGCVSALARRMRIPRVWATALTIGITLFYALFTGFGVPAQRSFWMITLYLLGRLLYRDRSPLNVIGFATLVIAAVSPRSIFDASLQMTVLSVAAIAGIAIPLMEKNVRTWMKATEDLRRINIDPGLPPRVAAFRVVLRKLSRRLKTILGGRLANTLPWIVRNVLRLVELVIVTLVVEMVLALPMAIYFHRVTVFALPVNLLILPLLGLLVPLAMLMLLALAAWPAIAIAPAAACLALLHFSLFIVRDLGGLAWADLRVPEPAQGQIACSLMLFVFALLLARGVFRFPVRIQRFAAIIAIAGMALIALWPQAVEHPTEGLLFEAIDVGQGDSLLLISPDGKTLLVDGGGVGFVPAKRPGNSSFDIGEDVVSEALWARGIRRLDAVALTHAHHDHMGGLPAILRNFRPRELWVGDNPPVAAYRDLLAEAGELGVQIKRLQDGDGRSLGKVEVRVLGPMRNYEPGEEPKNDDSLVLQARYGDTSILLAGDAEAPEEQSMMGEDLASTVLKVGHHGSLSSTRPAFLKLVKPEWAVISCGRRNRFGHPRREILEELEGAGVRTFRTDLDGASCLVLDGKTVTAEPMCEEVKAGRAAIWH